MPQRVYRRYRQMEKTGEGCRAWARRGGERARAEPLPLHEAVAPQPAPVRERVGWHVALPNLEDKQCTPEHVLAADAVELLAGLDEDVEHPRVEEAEDDEQMVVLNFVRSVVSMEAGLIRKKGAYLTSRRLSKHPIASSRRRREPRVVGISQLYFFPAFFVFLPGMGDNLFSRSSVSSERDHSFGVSDQHEMRKVLEYTLRAD